MFAGLVNCAGLKVGRDDIIDNTVATSLRSEAEGDRSLDRLLAVEGKGVGWRLLEVIRKSMAPFGLTDTSEMAMLVMSDSLVELESLPIVRVSSVPHKPTANSAANATAASRK